MSASTSASSERLFRIRQALLNYPVLGNQIRENMRRELFARGIIHPEAFETEVYKSAIESQKWEGLDSSIEMEAPEIWELRKERIRENLTDLRFSQNLAYEIFEGIVSDILHKRGVKVKDIEMTMNLELVPMEMVFEHAFHIESMPPEERSVLEHRLHEARVVLIRTLISDQLRYINIAREWFTFSDLANIRLHKIGAGRIGGKAAGMLLASRILKDTARDELKACLHTPESYYIGSGEMYTFMAVNNLGHWNNQKYKNENQLWAEYPQIIKDFEKGWFPADTIEKLKKMLQSMEKKPLIVRSSSLLEDNFNTSFAGKYESIFLPNQGTPEENLKELVRAMGRIYASTMNPNALLYRRSKGLLDYDERMALLVQEVQGERYSHYYMPQASGVAFSRNVYRWTPKIRKEDGFVRMVWGLGTRAVDRVGNDYPRMIALSHPLLRPSTIPQEIRRYSQQYVDLLDLENRRLVTMPVHEVLNGNYPALRYLAQMDENGYFSSLRTNILSGDRRNLVLTFEELLKRTPFAEYMREILSSLEKHYQFPIDLEFTLQLENPKNGSPKVHLTILQCRPQSHLAPTEQVSLPSDLPEDHIIFSTDFMVPEGYVKKVDYVIFVSPEGYFALPSLNSRYELGRAIGRLNHCLEKESFILVGPGRWGSSNTDLGVPVDYGKIFHSRSLVELTGQGIGPAPEPSLGTHFFQDLMEAQIYPLAVFLDNPNAIFNRDFFYHTENHLVEFSPEDESFESCLKLIKVSDFRPEHSIRIVMNEESSRATAYLTNET